MLMVFAVYDAKAESFATPMFFPAKGLAVRGFGDACRDPRSVIGQHHVDYVLYQIGTYDPNSGKLEALVPPVHVVSASSCVNAAESARLLKEPLLPCIVDSKEVG